MRKHSMRARSALAAVVIAAVAGIGASGPVGASADVETPEPAAGRPSAEIGAATSDLWEPVSSRGEASTGEVLLRGDDHVVVSTDLDLLRERLDSAPHESDAAARQAPLTIALPAPIGGYARFSIVETQVMAPELAAKFPSIRTYSGVGLDDPAATVALDLGPLGFHAQVLSPNGRWYVDPVDHLGSDVQVSYFAVDLVNQHDFEELGVLGEDGSIEIPAERAVARPAGKSSGTQLVTYRLAVAATGEYTAFHGGTKTLAMAEIVVAVNRLNQVYEQEVAAEFELVANNENLIFTDPNTDPYVDSDAGQMINVNTGVIDGIIGNGSYDIGHVFSTGGGGLAGLGVLGVSSQKGDGVTGTSNPVGDAFYIDYVAHEIGHQFGANHTFNSVQNACNGNRNAGTAVEPGSGITIMAYAGICSPDDLAAHSVPFFATVSYDEMRATMAGVPGVGTTEATGDSVPTISSKGGASFTIPPRTPFVLTAVGSDADGDTLSYSWEQNDVGNVFALADGSRPAAGPLFWFTSPTTSPSRFFPALSTIAANDTNAATGTCSSFNCRVEWLPTNERTMTFVGTARDATFGLSSTTVTVNVVGSTRFAVTSPNAGDPITNHSDVTVEWDVAGTNTGAVDTPFVDVYLSSDDGLTFPTLIAQNEPNDGSATVRINGVDGTNARIMVRGHGNIFFDTNDTSSTIEPGTNVPTAPRSVTGQAGDRRVKVSWKAPLDDGGPNVTKYKVVASPGGNSCSTTGSLSCTVTGLTAGTGYTFRVKATNVVGTGATSAASPTVTPYEAPGAPRNVAVKAKTGAIAVSWDAPKSNGGRSITKYVATASPGGKTCSTGGAKSCKIGNLSRTKSYTVTVKAKNAAGFGPASSRSRSVTPL